MKRGERNIYEILGLSLLIKCSKSIIAPQITSILNMSIDQSVFPDKLKKAQVTPLYKKNYLSRVV
jgi:hypothetical protein